MSLLLNYLNTLMDVAKDVRHYNIDKKINCIVFNEVS